jgi:hypothetical protein
MFCVVVGVNARDYMYTSLNLKLLCVFYKPKVYASGGAVGGVGPLPFACWKCGLDSRRDHACLFVVSVVLCQVKVPA